MPEFVHLHLHTQYSLLDGAINLKQMMLKAKQDGMKAVAITDHGNMFGVMHFVNEAHKHNIKPIAGCEFYIVPDRHRKTFTMNHRDERYHQLLLAKNKQGYKNLMKLCSLGYLEGLYGKYPRIDKELLEQYHEGLIATSCCIGAEIPQTILHKGSEEAEEKLQWWIELFGDDFYIELQRHNIANVDGTGVSQEEINQELIKLAEKYQLKIIATNDAHYLNREDAGPHEILLCVNTGDKLSTPVGSGKGYRFGFYNDEFYFKTQEEMRQLFSDLPQALDNCCEIADKVNDLKLMRDILLPNFEIPRGYSDADAYLRHIAFEGAKELYGVIDEKLEQRLNYELEVIRRMGFAGYFLIVQDFTSAARELGVSVGPGRGSAVGSVVAYCIGITNIEPLRYNLLFERFLNPERISMPDIDIDFDDEGRQKVIDYVIRKYGQNQVAQIVTYGTMAVKSAIRDVARVLDLPLDEADRLAKLVPAKPGVTFQSAYKESGDLKKIREGEDLRAKTLKMAEKLEGSVRNIGIHAAGVIIAPKELTEFIPVCITKDSEMQVTQFDGKLIEEAGLLKMDFLGLKTLSIIRDAIALIRDKQGIDIKQDAIPLDDQHTFELFQRGDTIGTFQFESDGMRQYLKDLKPTCLEDLIAMNALYRPGPMQFIEEFIQRKHGAKQVVYPHKLLVPILKETYGIMVYQEQIMQTAQAIAGYSLGEADILRRIMGKKKTELLPEEEKKFMAKAISRGIEKRKAKEVFDMMAKFAEYGFNKSHSAAYAMLAYLTGYLKANYPAEFMAAVLTNNMNDIKKVTYYMDECLRMGINVLGPDVNESRYKFAVNNQGAIRFGLGGVKGLGGGAVEAIIKERDAHGMYRSIFDLTKRIDLKSANKKCLESLAKAGAFDCFENTHRAQYFMRKSDSEPNTIELAIQYGNKCQQYQASSQQSLFGEDSEAMMLAEPSILPCEPWDKLYQLALEKEVAGMYLSGHPLNDYRLEIRHFCNHTLSDLKNLKDLTGKKIMFAAMVTDAQHRTDKNGNRYAQVILEDYNESFKLLLFKDDYVQFHTYLEKGWFLFMEALVRPHYREKDRYEIKIINMELLSELREKLAQSITIQLPIEMITEETVSDITNLAKKYKGNCMLKIQLNDRAEKISVSMFSRNYMIHPTDDFINKLEDSGMQYKFN